MPQEKNPEQTPKSRNPRVSKGEPPSPCHIHDKVRKVTEAETRRANNIRSHICVNSELPIEFKGKNYCFLHLPKKDKDQNKFGEIIKAKLKAVEDRIAETQKLPETDQAVARYNIYYDFRYIYFPPNGYYFFNHEFLVGASFKGATFSADAFFASAKFSAWANFTETKFCGITNFNKVNFAKDTFFDRTRFRNNVSFNSAIFGKDSDIFFRRAFFAKNADFQYCTAEGYVRFSNLRGNEYQFDFQEAAFEKASRISFHTIRLCPSWFINVDARKFIFTDIEWQNLESDIKSFKNKNIQKEIECLDKRGIKEQKKRLLEIAARQLAVNAEENNRYEEAAKFRYMAMEIKRLELFNKLSFSRYLIWLYKWTSGYGESWSWAAFVLICLLFFFGVFYNSSWANFEMPEKKQTTAVVKTEPEPSTEQPQKPEFYKMNNLEGFVYSLYVAALQRPEPKAADTTTRLFVILETIFAPLQAALLALAIRRKFMR